jgi:hypothetical protein
MGHGRIRAVAAVAHPATVGGVLDETLVRRCAWPAELTLEMVRADRWGV